MKIIVDENIPKLTALELRKSGHDVVDIRGTEIQGMDEEDLWNKAKTEKCLLITTDKGLSVRRFEDHYGLLIVRLKQPNRMKIHGHVMRAFGKIQEKQWRGLMVVVRDTVQSVWKSNSQNI